VPVLHVPALWCRCVVGRMIRFRLEKYESAHIRPSYLIRSKFAAIVPKFAELASTDFQHQ
jgi:hypothetical protein